MIVQPVVEPMDRFTALAAAESNCNTDHNLIIKTQHNSANFRNPTPDPPRQELRLETGGASNLVTRYSARHCTGWSLRLQTKVREDFTITEKAPNRPLSWLKEPTTFTFKTLC